MRRLPFAQALVAGAIHGVLAGVITASVCVLLAAAAPATARVDWMSTAVIAALAIAITATLVAGDDVSASVDGMGLSALVRFASGFAAPFVAVGPSFSLVLADELQQEVPLGLLVLLGIAFGFGQAAAGQPLAEGKSGCLRVFLKTFVAYMFVEATLGYWYGDQRRWKGEIFWLLAIGQGLLAIAAASTAERARRLTRWLDPDDANHEVAPLDAPNRHALARRACSTALREANGRRNVLEEALRQARLALELAKASAELARHIPEDEARVAEVERSVAALPVEKAS